MSHWSLSFHERIDYTRYDEITVEIGLATGAAFVTVYAKLDSGSKLCIFQSRYASLLGFNLESGTHEWIGAAAGSFQAYGHDVTLRRAPSANPRG